MSISNANNRRTILWVFFIIAFMILGTYGNTTIPVLSTRLSHYLNVGPSRLGVLLSATTIGQVMPLVIAGPVLDAIGPRRMLTLSFAGIVFAYVLASMASSYGLLFVSLLAVGVFLSTMALAVPLFITSLAPSWERRAFSIRMVSGLLSGLFFPVMVERLMARYPDRFDEVLHAPFGILAICGGLLFLLFVMRAPVVDTKIRGRTFRSFLTETSATFHSYPIILKSRRFWLYSLLLGLHGGADSTLLRWFPSYLNDTFTELPIGPGIVIMLYSAGYFLSRTLLIFMPESRGRRLFLVYPGIIGATILIVGVLAQEALISALAYPVAGFAWSFEAPALFAESFREFRQNYGTFQALFSLSPSILAITATSGTGLLVEAGLPLSLIVIACGACFAAFSIMALVGEIPRGSRASIAMSIRNARNQR